MTCVFPLHGYRVRGGSVTVVSYGDRPPRDATTRVPFNIPCQKCVGCRMERARQWGMRCLHEKKMWPDSSFVTLTYADEHMPPGMSLSLRDVQLFMKRLRKARNASASNPIRFFLCGEYGEENGRPHYHALLFNCGFGDRVHFGRNKRGEPLYTSRELSSLWSIDGQTLGHCTVGEVTFDSAVYCAKYALKKINVTERSTPEAIAEYERKYVVRDEYGEVFERRLEFAVQSRRPGIGATYFDKYGSEILAHDNVVINGRAVRPPRYYDLRALGRSKVHDDLAILCKCPVCRNRRKRMAKLNRKDNTPERLRVKGTLLQIAADKKERKL